MLKRTITYKDYEDVERTEDFYFNLTKAECAELELSEDGGVAKKLLRIVAAQDTKQIVEIFKELILSSYGEKSPDGRRFIKTKELRDAFSQTEAYSDLFMELSTNTDAAVEFVDGILPQKAVTKDAETN